MSSYGIKATIPGFDVRTSTDPTKLVLSSEYDSLKVATKGTISITTGDDGFGGGVGYGTVTHSLGYVPSFLVYGQRDSTLNNWFPESHVRGEWSGFTDYLPSSSSIWYNYINNSYLKIEYYNDTVGTSMNFVYYILHDELRT